MAGEIVLFYVFAALALASALTTVSFVRHPIAGAIGLLATMVSLSGIYVLLEAHFVAAVQILVYAGNCAVLFLFVILLVDLEVDDLGPPRRRHRALKFVGVAAALGFIVLCTRPLSDHLASAAATPPGFGGFRSIGSVLYTQYALSLDVLALVFLAAIVAAVILAARRIG